MAKKPTYEELEKQKNLFEAMLAATLDIFVLKDTNFVYQAVNATFCKFIGKPSRDIIGKTDFDLFPADEAEMYRRDDEKVIKFLKPVIQDEEVTGKESKKWLHVAKTPVFNNDKKLIGILCSVIDITERKKTQEELLASEEKYRKLFEEARDGIVLTDAETGIIIDCNPEIAKLLKRKKSELLGQHQRILHPQQAIIDGFSDTFIKHKDKFDGQILDTQVITSTGKIKDVAIKSNSFYLGNKKYLQGIFCDMTEQKKAREALRKSEELYRSLVEHIALGVVLIDLDHNVVMANEGLGRMLNKRPNELIGKKCFQEFEKREKVCPHCPGVIAMKTGQAAEAETVGVRDDGTTFDARNCTFPVFGSNGSVTGFIEIVEDITEKNELEAQLQISQRMEAIGTLAGGYCA